MEDLCNNLNSLYLAKNAQDSLQKIQELLLEFDSLLPQKASEADIKKIETSLLNLLKINNGILAPHFAICIASHLVPLYRLESSHRFWNLISLATDQPTPANVFAVGYVIKKIGHDSRSSLSNLAQLLPNVKEPLVYPALYTLKNIYKICGDIVIKSVNGAFSFAKAYTTSQNEPTQLAAIQLVQQLVVFNSVIPMKKFIAVAENTFKNCRSSFSIDECANLAAFCAAVPYIKTSKNQPEQQDNQQPESKDFAIQGKPSKNINSDLMNNLNVLKKFKNNFNLVFQKFLDFLEPEFIFKNVKVLIDFAMSVSPTSHTKVTTFFGRDIRSDLLKKLVSTPNIPFNQIRTLSYDAESAILLANIASKAIWANDEQDKHGACLYFTAFGNSYNEQARDYLSKTLDFLANAQSNLDVREYDGKMLIAALILSVIDSKQRVIETNKKNILAILSTIVSNPHPSAVNLQDYFMLLSILPDEFIDNAFVDKHINTTMDLMKKLLSTEERSRKMQSQLIEYCILFLSMHPGVNKHVDAFVELALQLTSSMSNVSHLGLLTLLTKIQLTESSVSTAAFFYLKFVSGLSFSFPFIKKKLPNLMRQPEDTLVRVRLPTVGKGPLFNVDEFVLSAKICDLLPSLFSKLSDQNVTKFMSTLIKTFSAYGTNSNSKTTIACIILSLYQNDRSRSRIPETFIDQLQKIATPDHLIRCQLISESIALHAASFRNCLQNTLTFLQKSKVVPTSCFISASLVHSAHLSEREINSLLKQAQMRLKDPQNVNFALHFIGELYEAKSVELASLCNGDEQLQNFYVLLNSPQVHSPYTLSLISFCVEKLLPILLPFIRNQSTQALLEIIMNAFLQAPIDFSKQFFHYIYRAAIAFSPHIALKFNITYPQSNFASTDLKLAVCGSLADLFQLKRFPPEMFDLIPQLMVLLQKTKDERVDHFIVSIAKSFDANNFSEETMTSYFRLCKKILSSGSAPGFGDSNVEPNTYVKTCALHIMRALFPILADHQPLITECLDNLMTSTTRAIETTKIELHSIAYPILTDVIEKFRYTKEKEGQHRLLELYESQFSIATRFAFPSSVDVSCSFLVSYLDFYFDDYKNNQQSFIMLLDNYVNGLQRILDKTSGFFSVSSRLCILARDSQSIKDHFVDFLKTLTPIFTQLVLDSIKLRSTRADWEEVSKYRSTMSPFYDNLLMSFVWLHKTFPSETTVINIETMTSFFLLEMTISSESWRINAAFSAIISIFHYFPDQLDIRMTQLVIFACADSVKKNRQLLNHHIPNFLLHTSRVLQKTEIYAEIWNYLCIILFKGTHCCPEALALLIKNAPHDQLSVHFAGFIVTKVSQKHYSEDEGIMLMTILYESAPAAIPAIIKHLCTTRIGHVVYFKVTSLRRALIRCPTRESFDKVAYYIIKHFDEGGLLLVAQLLVKNAGLGIDLLARGAANAAVYSIDESIDKAIEITKFFQLIATKVQPLKDETQFHIEGLKAVIHGVAKWGADKKRGRELIAEMKILSDQIGGDALKVAFEQISEEERNGAIDSMQKFAQFAKKKKSKLSLKKFSTNVRKQQTDDSDWQSLDIDE